jgi:hypothetical protein
MASASIITKELECKDFLSFTFHRTFPLPSGRNAVSTGFQATAQRK